MSGNGSSALLRCGVTLEQLDDAVSLYRLQQASSKRLRLSLEGVEEAALEQHKATVAQHISAIDRAQGERVRALAQKYLDEFGLN
jgi:hypothetical protein